MPTADVDAAVAWTSSELLTSDSEAVLDTPTTYDEMPGTRDVPENRSPAALLADEVTNIDELPMYMEAPDRWRETTPATQIPQADDPVDDDVMMLDTIDTTEPSTMSHAASADGVDGAKLNPAAGCDPPLILMVLELKVTAAPLDSEMASSDTTPYTLSESSPVMVTALASKMSRAVDDVRPRVLGIWNAAILVYAVPPLVTTACVMLNVFAAIEIVETAGK